MVSNTSKYFHGSLSEKVLERDSYSCVFCGSKEDLVVDHILSVKKSGKSTLENQRTLCRSCHSKISNNKFINQLTPIGKYLREWRKLNPDYLRDYHREWRKKHPGYYNATPEKYRDYKMSI